MLVRFESMHTKVICMWVSLAELAASQPALEIIKLNVVGVTDPNQWVNVIASDLPSFSGAGTHLFPSLRVRCAWPRQVKVARDISTAYLVLTCYVEETALHTVERASTFYCCKWGVSSLELKKKEMNKKRNKHISTCLHRCFPDTGWMYYPIGELPVDVIHDNAFFDLCKTAVCVRQWRKSGFSRTGCGRRCLGITLPVVYLRLPHCSLIPWASI